MDPQLRNFKDFLQLYNTMTELCFKSCVDNMYSREVTNDEDSCVDNCVKKYANVNQRLMGVYVEVQNDINAKRMKEYETQLAAQEEQQKLAAAAAAQETPEISNDTNIAPPETPTTEIATTTNLPETEPVKT